MGASEAGDRDSGEEEQDFPPLSPGQRLREIDERLAELRNSSPPSQVHKINLIQYTCTTLYNTLYVTGVVGVLQVLSPSVLQQLQSAHSRELSTGH